MSFSADVKSELMCIEEQNPCCALAESYGFLLFGKGFSAQEIYITTENEQIAEKYKAIVTRLSGAEPVVTCSENGKYRVSVKSKEGRAAVLNAFTHSVQEKNRRINWDNLADRCCMRALLRGAFLACGTLNSPDKNYHLEFVVPFLNLRSDLKQLMEELGLSPKEIVRNGAYILYFKKSEDIEDALTSMGAPLSSLELMRVKVYKDMRNNVNRRLNFENANLDKTVNAALRQNEAIQKLRESGVLQTLPKELTDIAELRTENPDWSLQQIGDMLTPPLSRSGVNHRLKKLCALAESC